MRVERVERVEGVEKVERVQRVFSLNPHLSSLNPFA
jgi:hypothetical protein